MPTPRPARLRHVPVRLRVTVDPIEWGAWNADDGLESKKLEAAVRSFCVRVLREQPLIHSVRRDGA